MTNRHPAIALVLAMFTCGIYYIYWLVSTKREMNRLGAEIPTSWLIIIPFVNIYWFWCWSQGVEKITKSGLTAVLSANVFVSHRWPADFSKLFQQSHHRLIPSPLPN